MRIIDEIIRREGSTYTNRSTDRGGPTKYGITQATLSGARGKPCSPRDVELLTEEEARDIYQKRYIDLPGFWRINRAELQELVVDCGVNHGPNRAARWLQAAVGFTGGAADGIVGRTTAEKVNTSDARQVFAEVLCTRNSFYEDLDDKDQSQEANQDGWVNRVNEFIRILATM